jgi:diguanylate cyclase (GGDEF)-like protein
LCVPLIVRGGIIGCVALDSTEVGAYGEREAQLLQAFSNEAAIAIENARLFQQVRQMAITDPLTGMYNRRHFFEAARVEFERARRYQHKLALIMMDVDYFKQVNDRHGHMVGDAVLLAVARLFNEKLREVDLVARYGGEEFVILLPETDTAAAVQVAERLRQALLEPILRQNGLEVTVSISFGVADARDAADLETLIHHADEALYSTKATRRGMVTAWGSPDQQDAFQASGGKE